MNALILVDHGSKIEEANEVLKRIAAIIKTVSQSGFDIVEYCHMELGSPTIEEALNKCVKLGAKNIVFFPYFLIPGKHSTQDIPEMIKKAAKQHRGVRYKIAEPLGIHPKIIEVVLEKSKVALKDIQNKGSYD